MLSVANVTPPFGYLYLLFCLFICLWMIECRLEGIAVSIPTGKPTTAYRFCGALEAVMVDSIFTGTRCYGLHLGLSAPATFYRLPY